MVQLEQLRRALHDRVDEEIDAWIAGRHTRDAGDLDKITDTEAWSFRWPAGNEDYYKTSIYRDISTGTQLRVAWGHRDAWSQKDRGRIVVFGRTSESANWWPWIEWTEADDGRWSAAIYPTRKRRQLRRGDPVPSLPVDGDIVPVGDVYKSVKSGDTVRLVVSADQEQSMARYGLFVGRQRHGVGS